jgi:hypothetical protein
VARFDTVVTVSGLVFVSYSHVDRPYVEALAAHLRAADIEVWYDDELAAGDRFDAMIHVQIDECDARHRRAEPRRRGLRVVDREIGYALQQGKKVVPLLLSPCEDQALLVNVHHDDVTTGTMPSARFMDHLANLIASRTVGGVLDRTQLTVAPGRGGPVSSRDRQPHAPVPQDSELSPHARLRQTRRQQRGRTGSPTQGREPAGANRQHVLTSPRPNSEPREGLNARSGPATRHHSQISWSFDEGIDCRRANVLQSRSATTGIDQSQIARIMGVRSATG